MKARIDRFLHEALVNEDSNLHWMTSNFIISVTMVSIIVVLIDYEPLVKIEEIVVTTIFILEYVANAYITKPTRKYILSVHGVIDLIAIAPSLIIWLSLPQLKVARGLRMARYFRFLRMMRLLRLARVLKLASDAEGDTGKQVGVTILGVGILVLAVLRGFRESLPSQTAQQMLIVGSAFVVVGNLVFIIARIRLYKERQEENEGVENVAD